MRAQIFVEKRGEIRFAVTEFFGYAFKRYLLRKIFFYIAQNFYYKRRVGAELSLYERISISAKPYFISSLALFPCACISSKSGVISPKAFASARITVGKTLPPAAR